MCGWCYGFTVVMEAIYSKYRDTIDFNVVCGGLALRERAGFINDVAPYCKEGAYLQVEKTTGVRFGELFVNNVLKNNSMFMDSTYLAIALCIV